MIEILHPTDDAPRIAELRGAGIAEVDAWATAFDDHSALAALDATVPPLRRDELIDHSRYIVYPWRNTMVRLPRSEIHHRLRTTRNSILITDTEQKAWSRATIAVAGLSVGASLLHTCVLTGARRFRIADPDILGPTNLNRLSGSVCDLGIAKSTLACRRMLETDPYLSVQEFPDGFSATVARAFLGGDGVRGADVVLEEVDDLAMKVEIRRRARAAGIPVVMVTDDGDNVIVDVERYDLDPSYPEFHGMAGDLASMSAEELRDPGNRIRIAGAIVGGEVSSRVAEALTEVGRSIPSWPQLGSAATLAGAVGATVARRIVCGEPVVSGRAHVRIHDLLAG
ncbi:ThiF family adenylyltransferase [Gordonia sp. NPDC003376]